MAGFVAVDADAGVGVVEFSVVESVYYVLGAVYWDWIGVVASAWGGGCILCSHAKAQRH